MPDAERVEVEQLPAGFQRVVGRYFRNIRWAYIGDPSRIRRERLLDF